MDYRVDENGALIFKVKNEETENEYILNKMKKLEERIEKLEKKGGFDVRKH